MRTKACRSIIHLVLEGISADRLTMARISSFTRQPSGSVGMAPPLPGLSWTAGNLIGESMPNDFPSSMSPLKDTMVSSFGTHLAPSLLQFESAWRFCGIWAPR